MSFSLQELDAQTPVDEPGKTETVDISSFYGKDPDTIVLTWQEPDIPRLSAARDEVFNKKNWRAFPGWPVSLKQSVCVMGVSHVAPLKSGDVPALFYAGIAKKNKNLWNYLTAQYQLLFPDVAGVETEEDEITTEKNA